MDEDEEDDEEEEEEEDEDEEMAEVRLRAYDASLFSRSSDKLTFFAFVTSRVFRRMTTRRSTPPQSSTLGAAARVGSALTTLPPRPSPRPDSSPRKPQTMTRMRSPLSLRTTTCATERRGLLPRVKTSRPGASPPKQIKHCALSVFTALQRPRPMQAQINSHQMECHGYVLVVRGDIVECCCALYRIVAVNASCTTKTNLCASHTAHALSNCGYVTINVKPLKILTT